jgi:hypothetical protein
MHQKPKRESARCVAARARVEHFHLVSEDRRLHDSGLDSAASNEFRPESAALEVHKDNYHAFCTELGIASGWPLENLYKRPAHRIQPKSRPRTSHTSTIRSLCTLCPQTPQESARAKTVRTTQARCNVRTARSWEKRATFALRIASSATGYIVREHEGSRQKCLIRNRSLSTRSRISRKMVYSRTSSHLK